GPKPENCNRLYDAETGRPVPLPPAQGFVVHDVCRLSGDGTRLFAFAAPAGGTPALTQFRFPAMTVVRTDPGFPANVTDDAGTVAVAESAIEDRAGLYVFRVGERRPLAVFDPGHQPVGCRMTPDGRFAHWGREDGTARVADLTRALERLTTLTGR